MRIGGAWVGLGVDDVDPEIGRLKTFMRRKFSYAAHLADTDVFDEQMFTAVYEMQSRYHAQGKLPAPTGIVNFDTKRVMGFIKVAPPALPTLFTVHGTAVSMWDGPPADTARAVADMYRWQPVGNYPAKAFPMGPSVDQGRAELIHQIELNPGPFALAGYSQGAIVTSLVWKYDLSAPNGVLHHRLADCRKIVTWGNPMRQRGYSWGTTTGAADNNSHGIADDLLTNTPSFQRDFAHKGDLYTDVQGESGEFKTAIYKVIMGQRVFSGPDSLLAQVLEVMQSPLLETVAMFRAIIDAGMFFVRGTGPHVSYSVQPAVDFLRAQPLTLAA